MTGKKAEAAKKVGALLRCLDGSCCELPPACIALTAMHLCSVQDTSFEGKLRRKILLLSRQLQVGLSGAP